MGADGTVTATSTGGMVTAMTSYISFDSLETATAAQLPETGREEGGGREGEARMAVSAKRYLTVFAATAVLALGLYGCGGGGGEGPMTDAGQIWRNNPTAEDLLDHWNDADALKSTLGLSMVSQADIDSRKTLIRNLINSAGSDPATSGTILRNVDPDDIEIIGERDGVTYGQWKGGSAGTLNIKFDWLSAENVGAATRARMERAGKSWSHRIMDKNRDREAPSGTMFVHEADAFNPVRVERTLDENVSTNGVLIFVLDQGANSGIYSFASQYDPNYRPDVLDPWLASILLSRRHHESTYTMAHEIGHTLGIFPNLDAYTAYDNLVNRADHTFEGPQAMRANGGDPVPFQWWSSDFQPVAPSTPGATVDYTHPGDCDSIMSYCSAGTLERPSELDFAFLADLGYDILDADTASEPELYGYGAWGRYSAWGAGVERDLEYEDDGTDISARDQLRAGADAFGDCPEHDTRRAARGGVFRQRYMDRIAHWRRPRQHTLAACIRRRRACR